MRIAIAQIATVAGSLDATVARMVAQSEAAAKQDADLLLFPMSALSGLDLPASVDQQLFSLDLAHALASLAQQLACPAIVPFVSGTGDIPLPMALLVRDHKIVPLGMLSVLAMSGDAEPSDTDGPIELSFGGHNLAIALSYEDLDVICDYDYECDVIIYMSGYGFAADDPSSAMGASLSEGRFLMDAQSTNAWLVGVGGLGGYSTQVLTGSSFVLSPHGELVACAPAFEESLLVADLVESPDTDTTGTRCVPEMYDLSFHLWQALALSLHDAVVGMSSKDVAMLVGDDIASRVLFTLAVDALGPTHVHAAPRTLTNDAKGLTDLARRLRVSFEEIDVPLRTTALSDPMLADDIDLMRAQGLVRSTPGTILLSSLDKTGLALGCWSPSQTVADLYPLADVYRSDILDMAHMRNAISPLFPGLGFGEADAIEIGVGDRHRTYSTDDDILLVDQILLSRIEYGRSYADLLTRSHAERTLVDDIMSMLVGTDSFRRRIQPVLIMSSRTLSDEQRPLGFTWTDNRDVEPNISQELDELHAFMELESPAKGSSTGSGIDAQDMDTDTGMGLREALDMLRDLVEQSGMAPQDGGASLFETLQRGPFSEN